MKILKYKDGREFINDGLSMELNNKKPVKVEIIHKKDKHKRNKIDTYEK